MYLEELGQENQLLIKCIAEWSEYFLKTPGDSSDRPYIVKCAPTGAATSLIKGITLQSAFHLNFANMYISLSDETRDKLRDQLANLKIIVIDEFSMVGSDLLYMLHQQLQEIKQNEDDFGGLSVIMFGGVMQLRPVKGRYIFEEPKNNDLQAHYFLNNLWEKFSSIELEQNHRQGTAKYYAHMLNEIRFGRYSREHVAFFESKIIDINKANAIKKAVYIYGDNRNASKCND